jgi:hypothetical protein
LRPVVPVTLDQDDRTRLDNDGSYSLLHRSLCLDVASYRQAECVSQSVVVGYINASRKTRKGEVLSLRTSYGGWYVLWWQAFPLGPIDQQHATEHDDHAHQHGGGQVLFSRMTARIMAVSGLRLM